MCRRLVIGYHGNLNGYHANRFYRGIPDTSELGDGKDNQSLLMHCVNHFMHTQVIKHFKLLNVHVVLAQSVFQYATTQVLYFQRGK